MSKFNQLVLVVLKWLAFNLLKLAFNFVDKDKDGKISKEELKLLKAEFKNLIN